MPIERQTGGSSNDSYSDNGFSQSNLSSNNLERELKESSVDVSPDRVTTLQRNLLQVEKGEVVFNTDTGENEYWNGSSWIGEGTQIDNNLDNRIITFGGKNSFTDELAASVSPLAEVYHSKRSAKLRKEALRKFKEGEVNVLCSTKALNQGFDVPNANVGVICGLTSKALSMVQRVGRLIRFEEGKKGLVYVLYVKDSQEEKWLKNSVQKLNGVKWL